MIHRSMGIKITARTKIMTDRPTNHEPLFKLPYLVEHRDFNYLYKCMMACIELTELTGEPNCMSLEGMSGVGKSTLVKAVANDFQTRNGDSPRSSSVLYVITPAPATIKGLQATILEELGDPEYSKGSTADMNARVLSYLKNRRVKLMILDEIQHLKEIRRANDDHVSDWLKVLIKKSEIPFVVVGLDGTIEGLLQNSTQLSRLFARREKLERFLDTKTGRKDFSGFVKLAIKGNGIQVEGINESELMRRMHYCTRGIVGNVVNLLQTSSYLARQERTPAINTAMLAAAYEIRLAKHVGGHNLFADPPEKRARIPKEWPIPGEKKPVKKRTNKRQRSSDILKTS